MEASSQNVLHLTTAVDEQGPMLRPVIDGVDILSLQQNDRGLDPDRLLPPLSHSLLPTTDPRPVIVGACSCGETGCGSLSLLLRRRGNEVLWEPVEQGEALTRTYVFDLVEYLDAIDAAVGDRVDEGRGRRVARLVSVMLGMHDSQFGLSTFSGVAVDWISAWPWRSESVRVSVTRDQRQTVEEFHAESQETDREFAARVATWITKARYGGTGTG